MEDVVKSFGYLTLGTRLKRLGELLQAQTQTVVDESYGTVTAGQFPFLAAIDRLGPLTVGEMAAAIGIAQPGATRTVAQLTAAGLLAPLDDPSDRRIRRVDLSHRGRAIVERAKVEMWPVVEQRVASVCRGLEGDLLSQVNQLEDILRNEGLFPNTRKEKGR